MWCAALSRAGRVVSLIMFLVFFSFCLTMLYDEVPHPLFFFNHPRRIAMPNKKRFAYLISMLLKACRPRALDGKVLDLRALLVESTQQLFSKMEPY